MDERLEIALKYLGILSHEIILIVILILGLLILLYVNPIEFKMIGLIGILFALGLIIVSLKNPIYTESQVRNENSVGILLSIIISGALALVLAKTLENNKVSNVYWSIPLSVIIVLVTKSYINDVINF